MTAPKNTAIHPVVTYINSVNKQAYVSVDDVLKDSIFLVVEYASGERAFSFGNISRSVLKELNPDKNFYTKDELDDFEISSIIKSVSAGYELEGGGLSPSFSLKESRNALLSASVMHFLGFASVALEIIQSAMVSEKLKFEQLHIAHKSSVIMERYKQHLKSAKPRNTHYEEAIKIISDTWSKYPAASKAGMCSKLHHYFNGAVSKDSINRWIKKSKLQPPKPERYTAFSLIINAD